MKYSTNLIKDTHERSNVVFHRVFVTDLAIEPVVAHPIVGWRGYGYVEDISGKTTQGGNSIIVDNRREAGLGPIYRETKLVR